jgi:hypothetical protein
MELVTISLRELSAAGDPAVASQAREWCGRLEAGDIIFFPETPIKISSDDLQFLLGQQQTASSLHKNVAYKPAKDEVTGLDAATPPEAQLRLKRVLGEYTRAVTSFLTHFLTPYEGRWQLDYGSFRPQEEESRDLPLRKRNDLLHTDAFPTRPTRGARILRFFNNIHPSRTRNWITTDTFGELAPRFAPRKIALPRAETGLGRAMKAAAGMAGLGKAVPSLKRTPYDEFMMRFHNFLKENAEFQRDCTKNRFDFPPGSSWMVYTDTVSHAVLSGQYALEQTFLVSPEAMVRPEVSPLGVLERMTGAKLI